MSMLIDAYRGASGGGGLANITFLMQMEGADGGSDFNTDVISGNTWVRGGDPRTSTTEFKFGTSSMFPNGGQVSCATALGSGVGTGEFCIEGFAYVSSAGSFIGLFDTLLNGTINGIAVGFNNGSSEWQVYFGGSAHNAAGTIPLTTWFHFALERVGTTVTLYIDGVVANTFTSAASNTDTTLAIGAYFNSSTTLNGWIDECRGTVGAYQYGGPFTPPAVPFPTS